MTMPALILVAVAASLPGAPASPRAGADTPTREQIEASVQKIKELQKERIALLKLQVAAIDTKARRGQVDHYEVLEARLQLLQAELEVTEKGADRIALYKSVIEVLKNYEEIAKNRMAAGQGSQVILLGIQVRQLGVEIQMEREKLREATEGK